MEDSPRQLELRWESSPDGESLATIGGVPLHSRKDPRKEAERFVVSLCRDLDRDPSLRVLLVGTGMGYHLEIPDLLHCSSRLLIFEPHTGLFVHHRKEGHWKRWIDRGFRLLDPESPNIPPPDGSGVSWTIRFFPSYHRLRGLRTLAEKFLAERSQQNEINRSTIQRFLKTWTNNALIRILSDGPLEYLPGNPGPEDSADLPGFQQTNRKNSGAVLYCGAGPELTEELEILIGNPDLRASVFLIGSDSALAPLLSLGLRPDLIFSIDSGRGTLYHLEMARILDERTLSNLSVLSWLPGPRFLSHFFSRIFYYPSSFPVDQMLLSSGEIPGHFWENRSRNQIALALHMARHLGLETLFTAGANFVSRGRETHCPGTGYQKYYLEKWDRLHPAPTFSPPGAYRPEATGKNALAIEGLQTQARDMQLKVLPLHDPANRNLFASLSGKPGHWKTIRMDRTIEKFLRSWNKEGEIFLKESLGDARLKQWKKRFHSREDF